MDKVSFIRKSQKIAYEEEYKELANKEEIYIGAEKLKFADDTESM